MELLLLLKTVLIYTDGACSGNPGPGGFGALLRYNQTEKEISGGEPMTTNNRMELRAAIEALSLLKNSCAVELYTDSKYVQQGITAWIPTWKKNQWRNSRKEAVKNIDLWQTLDELNQKHQIHWHWLKGHAGHPENERADELARRGISRI